MREPGVDRGALSLEMAILFPVVLLTVMVTLNTGLWFHARNTALAAAQEGARTARSHGGNPGAAEPAALAFARTTGKGFLEDPQADASASTSTTVVVRVEGNAVSVFPGLTLRVSQEARAPREEFTTPGQSP